MEEMNIFDKPHLIYNLDEKGCQLTLHHQQQVYAQKGAKRVHVVAPEHAQNVTVVGCISATGSVIPPFILFKGKRRNEDWIEDMPTGAAFTMTEKGSMTHAAFVEWLEHFNKFKPSAEKVLLIFDGVKSHLSIDIVEEAEKYNVKLYCLPSNTTHELQPLDKTIFRSFEHYWDDELLKFWRTRPDRSLSKAMFGKVLTPVWSKCMSLSNINSGFKATGIYPFNRDAIPDIAFAPSEVTRNLQTDIT